MYGNRTLIIVQNRTYLNILLITRCLKIVAQALQTTKQVSKNFKTLQS